jgi:hypothetical protein
MALGWRASETKKRGPLVLTDETRGSKVEDSQ